VQGEPPIPEHVRHGGTQRTNLKVVQSFLANSTTCTHGGVVKQFQYKSLGLGVYEFWFGERDI
jgi:hypothetical protein